MCRAKRSDNASYVDGLMACSLVAVAALLLGSRAPLFGQQANPSPVSAIGTVPNTTQVLGLDKIKRGAKGRLAIAGDTLRFDVGTAAAEISIASIQDVFTDQDSKQLVAGKKGTVAKLAMPYGSGRVLSLFGSEKIDVLTMEYRDSNGGLHGVIFTLPKGQAPAVKGRLAELGAHASMPPEAPAEPRTASGQVTSEKISASAIQIAPVESKETALPPEFRVAIYENLVDEVGKTGKFPHVYRSGDRAAADAPDLLILRTRVEGFKQGSQKQREVTTVAGATTIKTSVQVVTRDGRTVLNRQVEGKVRFFGENLNATSDFAKKAAEVIREATGQI
jgi:hypothetical protein